MKLGIEVLLANKQLKAELAVNRVALLAHPASVDHNLIHSVDALFNAGIKLSAVFGPQHGMKGDKQDNMIESKDELDPSYGIPVYSLYGESRRLSETMLSNFDLILIDLQDIGGRIYTFITTILYILEECGAHQKQVWILDRPNPAGRPIDGLTLITGQESFVGAGPMPMRHGMTIGELSRWFIDHYSLGVECRVVEMQDYHPEHGPGYGWPIGELAWVNPSPNAASLNMARCYSGTVLIEGTELSEGRGTTRPLEIMGAPDIDAGKVLKAMSDLAPEWLKGCILRECYFEPTFHKHSGRLCHGLQIHTDVEAYNHHQFKSFRIVALFLKAVRNLYPEYNIWRDFHYEYEKDSLAIDVINGGPLVRQWIDNSDASREDLAKRLESDTYSWLEQRERFLVY